MKKIISCCGVVCSDCGFYPEECKGCPAIEGKVYWLSYVGAEVCPIYDCCVNEKHLMHCGQCEEVPCQRYQAGDPTKTKEENAEILKKQVTLLKSL